MAETKFQRVLGQWEMLALSFGAMIGWFALGGLVYSLRNVGRGGQKADAP